MINYLVFLEKKEADYLHRRAERLDKVREAIEPLLRRLDELYSFDDCLDPKPAPLGWIEVEGAIDKILRAFGEDAHKWRYGR